MTGGGTTNTYDTERKVTMNESLKKITIRPEWEDIFDNLEPLESYCMIRNILNYVLYGDDIVRDENYEDRYDRYERLAWEKIRDDIDEDLESQ